MKQNYYRERNFIRKGFVDAALSFEMVWGGNVKYKGANMEYLSKEHEERFCSFTREDHTGIRDRERKSLFYIITGNNDLYGKKHLLYDSKNHCIIPVFTEEKRSVDLSGGAKALVQLGFNLYNGINQEASVSDIFGYLDEPNRILAWNAIKMRYL